MPLPSSWEHWENIVVEWINGLQVERHRRIAFQDLSDGKLFERIIQEVLKVSVSPEKTAIESFLQTEYPDIQLNFTTSKHDLLLASLLIHYWSMRLCESEHRARERVCSRLNDESEKVIRRFLEKLLPASTVHITNEQLLLSIESLAPSSKEVFPSTPASKAPARNLGSLGKFLNSPVAKQQKLLAESQRRVRELTSELDQEQVEKVALEKEVISQTGKARKFEAQLKAALEEVAKLEDDALKLQEDSSKRDTYKELRACKEEIKSLELYISELKSTQQPLEDENFLLETRCESLKAALSLLENCSKDQEILIAELSQEIQTKDKQLEDLNNLYQELQTFVKGMPNRFNESSDFDTSMTSFSHLPGSPMPVLDTLPLSNTVVDKQLQEKLVEVTNLQSQIETVGEKITEVFAKCNCDRSVDGDTLLDLEIIANTLEQRNKDLVNISSEVQSLSEDKLRLVEEQRNLVEENLAQESKLLEARAEIKSMLTRCENYDLTISELNCMIDSKEELIAKANAHCQELASKLSAEGANNLQLSQSLAEVSSQLSEISLDKLHLSESLEQTAARLTQAQDTVNSLEIVCKEKNEEIGALCLEREKLSEDLVITRAHELRLTETRQRLERELADSQSEAQALLLSCGKKDEELKGLREELSSEKTKLSVICSERDDLHHQLESAKLDATEKESAILLLTEEKTALGLQLQIAEEDRCKIHNKYQAQEVEYKKTQSEFAESNSRCQDLEASLSERDRTIDKLNTDASTLHQQLEGLSNELAALKDSEVALQESLRRTETELSKSREDSNTLESRCNENDGKIAQLEASIVERDAELSVVTCKQARLQQEFDDAQKLLVDKQNEIHKFIEECGDLGSRLDLVMEERNKLSEDCNRQEAETLKSRAEVESLVLRCDDYVAKIADLDSCIAEKTENIANLEGQYNLMSSRLEESHESENTLKESIQKMEIELSNAGSTLDLISQENAAKTAELEALILGKNTELEVLSGKHALLHKEFEVAQQRLAEQQTEIGKFTKECSDLGSRLDLVIEERNKLSEDCNRQEAETLKSRAEVESLMLRCDDYVAKIADLDSCIAEKTENIADLEGQCNLMSSRLEESCESENTLKESIQKMEIELSNAASALELISQENAAKTSKLETLILGKNTELEVLSDKHALLCKEFEDAQKLLVDKQNEIHKVIEECGDLSSRLDLVIEERIKLSEDCNRQEAETLKSRAEVESLVLRCDDYVAKIADLDSCIAEKTENIADLEGQCNLMSSGLEESREAENTLKESLQKMENELSNAASSMELASQENAAKTSDLETLILGKNTELEVLSGKYALLHKEFEDAQKRLAEQHTEIGKFIEECGDLSSRLEVVIDERTRLTEDLCSQESEVKESHAKIESLVLLCDEYKTEIAVMEGSIVQKTEEIARTKEDQHVISNELSETRDAKIKLEESLQQMETSLASLQEEANVLRQNHVENENKLTVFARTEAEMTEKLGEFTRQHGDQLEELKDVHQQLDEKKLEVSRLSELVDNFKGERDEVFAEKAALSVRISEIAGEVERLSEENKSLKSEFATSESFCDKFILQLSNILSSASEAAETVSSNVVEGSSRCPGGGAHLIAEGLISRIANTCEKYRTQIAEAELSVAKMENGWSADFLQLKEKITLLTESCDELKAKNIQLQSALTVAENARDEQHTENENWMQKYVLVEEKVASMEQTLVAVNSNVNYLKLQAQALKERNAQLMTELESKIRCCLDWETVNFEMSNFKQIVGKRMENLDLLKSKLEDQLSDARRMFDHLNTCNLVDAANLKKVESLKLDISNTLSRLEEKFNGSSLDLLSCVYLSLSYPNLLIQQQLSKLDCENTTHSDISHHLKDVPIQVEQVETAMKTLLPELQEIPKKIKELQDYYLEGTAPATNNVSLFDDSLEEHSLMESKESEPRSAIKALVPDSDDPCTVAIGNVMENIVVSHTRQFRTLVTLKNEIRNLDSKNKFDCMEMLEALKCKEKLEEKVIEQQNTAAQLKKEYNTLLKDCELALKDSHKLKELLARQEKETQQKQKQAEQLEAQTKQLEDKLNSCFTEAQVGQKVEKLGSEYEEKLERMKAKMRDLFRKETAKFDEMKALACAETEKLCKSEYDNQIKKYKLYVREQTLEIDELKQKLSLEQMETAAYTKKAARLEAQLEARNTSHHDPLLMKRDSVMEHLQRRAEPRVLRTHTATSTTIERDVDAASGFCRRQSISTRQSVTSLHNIPSESFAAEDEEGEVFNNTYLGDLKAGRVRMPPALPDGERLGELQYRNSLCPPHLKSSYPAETQFHDPQSFRDDDVKLGFLSDVDHSDTSSLSALLLPGERQRKRDRGKNQTSYQKPGPPTPIKNGGRRSLQGGELLSPRAALREVNDGARAKVSTPNRIRQLFSAKNKRDENSPMTPRGRRLSLFRKSARGRDDC